MLARKKLNVGLVTLCDLARSADNQASIVVPPNLLWRAISRLAKAGEVDALKRLLDNIACDDEGETGLFVVENKLLSTFCKEELTKEFLSEVTEWQQLDIFMEALRLRAFMLAARYDHITILNYLSTYINSLQIKVIKHEVQRGGKFGSVEQAIKYICHIQNPVLQAHLIKFAQVQFNFDIRQLNEFKDTICLYSIRMTNYSLPYETAKLKLSNLYLMGLKFQYGYTGTAVNANLATGAYLAALEDNYNDDEVYFLIHSELFELVINSADHIISERILQYYASVPANPKLDSLIQATPPAVQKYQVNVGTQFNYSISAQENPKLPSLFHTRHLVVTAVAKYQEYVTTQFNEINPFNVERILNLLNMIFKSLAVIYPALQIYEFDSTNPTAYEKYNEISQPYSDLFFPKLPYAQYKIIQAYTDQIRNLLEIFKKALESRDFTISYFGLTVVGDPKGVTAIKNILNSLNLKNDVKVRAAFLEVFHILQAKKLEAQKSRFDDTAAFYNSWLREFEKVTVIEEGFNVQLVNFSDVGYLNDVQLKQLWLSETIDNNIKLYCGIVLNRKDADFKPQFEAHLDKLVIVENQESYRENNSAMFTVNFIGNSKQTILLAIAYAEIKNTARAKQILTGCLTSGVAHELSQLPAFLRLTFLNLFISKPFQPQAMYVPDSGELAIVKKKLVESINIVENYSIDVGFQCLCGNTPLGMLFGIARAYTPTSLTTGTKVPIVEFLEKELSKLPAPPQLQETTRKALAWQIQKNPDFLKILQKLHPCVYAVALDVMMLEQNNTNKSALQVHTHFGHRSVSAQNADSFIDTPGHDL